MTELSDRDRKIYATVREKMARGERPTIDAVAQCLDLPRSSVAKVALKVGYRGWTDMVSRLGRYSAVVGSEGALKESVSFLVDEFEKNRNGRVVVDAIGDSEVALDYSLLRLAELGFNVVPYAPGIIRSLESADKRCSGMLLVINESGMSLVPSCIGANRIGFDIVSVTGSHDTPVSKLSNVNVVIKSRKSRPEAYEPNYFTAGVFALLERVFTNLEC